MEAQLGGGGGGGESAIKKRGRVRETGSILEWERWKGLKGHLVQPTARKLGAIIPRTLGIERGKRERDRIRSPRLPLPPGSPQPSRAPHSTHRRAILPAAPSRTLPPTYLRAGRVRRAKSRRGGGRNQDFGPCTPKDVGLPWHPRHLFCSGGASWARGSLPGLLLRELGSSAQGNAARRRRIRRIIINNNNKAKPGPSGTVGDWGGASGLPSPQGPPTMRPPNEGDQRR